MFLFLMLGLHVAAFGITGEQSEPFELIAGSKVVLKTSGTPLFDQGRQVSSLDHLIFLVERVMDERVEVIARDKAVRDGCSAIRSFRSITRMCISPALSPTIPRMRRHSGFTASVALSSRLRTAPWPTSIGRFDFSPTRAVSMSPSPWCKLTGSNSIEPSKTVTRRFRSMPEVPRPYLIRRHAAFQVMRPASPCRPRHGTTARRHEPVSGARARQAMVGQDDDVNKTAMIVKVASGDGPGDSQ